MRQWLCAERVTRWYFFVTLEDGHFTDNLAGREIVFAVGYRSSVDMRDSTKRVLFRRKNNGVSVYLQCSYYVFRHCNSISHDGT